MISWYVGVSGLETLSDTKVPRCVKRKHFRKIDSIQLHYFSDASEEGYGVGSYLRIVDSQGNIACIILLGKARVTMLRLELTATTVAVKLHKQIREELTLPIHEAIFWTDSTIVLQYIKNSHTRFQTFVANRLAIDP